MDINVAAMPANPVALKESNTDVSPSGQGKQGFSEVYNQEESSHDDDLLDQSSEDPIAQNAPLTQPVNDSPVQAVNMTLQSLVAESIASNDGAMEDFSDAALDIVVCKQNPMVTEGQVGQPSLEMTEDSAEKILAEQIKENREKIASTYNSKQLPETINNALHQVMNVEAQSDDSPLMSKSEQIQVEMSELEANFTVQESTPTIVNQITNQPNTSARQILPQQVAVDVPVTDNGWREAFSEKVLWLTNQNVKSAIVQLNPQELGPIEVSIKVNQQQASIVMNAQQGATREALADAMPNLRSLLADSGIQLQEFNIQDGQAQQGRQQEAFYNRDDVVVAANEMIEASNDVKPAKVLMTRLNAIDYYA